MAEDDVVFVLDTFEKHVERDHGEDDDHARLERVFLGGRIHENYNLRIFSEE